MRILQLIAFLTLILSCNNSNKPTVENLEIHRTKKLLAHIFHQLKSVDINFDCIYEKTTFFENTPEYDYYSQLLKHLKISDSTHLNNQIIKYEKFLFNEEYSLGKKIIPDSLTPTNRQELETIRQYIKNNCPNGALVISRPIFNETFELAFIIYSGEFGGSGNIFEYKNENWEFVKSIYDWIY
ncbi:hypothetical protein [Altibacter lentus]|uniref:hypothetical protein n=1 Tax=Altibacter lentus TaxID=1223410 RepID=UPI000557029E|nr:hypothetical protein [Altibacter lentus]